MASKKFVKMDVYMFNSNKFKLIKCSERWYIVAAVWVSLLLEAGKKNDKGLIYLSKNIPYSIDMLSVIFDLPVEDIKYSFDILQKYAMIEIHEDGVIEIINWCEYQEPKARPKKIVDTKVETIEDTVVAEAAIEKTAVEEVAVDDINQMIEDNAVDEVITKGEEGTSVDEAVVTEGNINDDILTIINESKKDEKTVVDGTNSLPRTMVYSFNQDGNTDVIKQVSSSRRYKSKKKRKVACK